MTKKKQREYWAVIFEDNCTVPILHEVRLHADIDVVALTSWFGTKCRVRRVRIVEVKK